MPLNMKDPGTPGGTKGWGGTKSAGGQPAVGGTKVWDELFEPGGQKAAGGTKVECSLLFIRPDIRNKLRELGMSDAGINSLVMGGMMTDKNDKAIVAQIVAAALQ